MSGFQMLANTSKMCALHQAFATVLFSDRCFCLVSASGIDRLSRLRHLPLQTLLLGDPGMLLLEPSHILPGTDQIEEQMLPTVKSYDSNARNVKVCHYEKGRYVHR